MIIKRSARGIGGILTIVTALMAAHLAHASNQPPAGLELRPRGEYFQAHGVAVIHQPLPTLRFEFQNLTHRAPWTLFFVMLDHTVDLTQGELRLRFDTVSDDLSVKIEVRDHRFERWHNAHKRVHLPGGRAREISFNAPDPFDALLPGRWNRQVLWPDFKRIQFVGVIVEARYNTPTHGQLVLEGIDYVPTDGPTKRLTIWSDRVFCDEYAPAITHRQWAKDLETDQIELETQRRQLEAPRPEVTVDVKRDDPSSALFISGQGYKIDPIPSVGLTAQASIKELPHDIDGLLLSVTRHLRFPERPPGTTDTDIRRAALDEPVDVSSWAGQLIFDPVQGANAGWPRFTFTYEDVDVESDSTITLDFRQQIHEMALLWSTPYLDQARRWRLTLEPAYQYWRVTSATDAFASLDKHRGILSATLRDEWEQREFFLLGYYGRSNHKDVDADEREHKLLAEWRQWYGPEQFAFSTLGVSFTETKFEIGPGSLGAMDTNGPRDDHLRQFKMYATLITELDNQGQWRWVAETSFKRTTADILIFFPTGETDNVAFDSWQLESRFVHEILPDVDVSVGLEHAVADEHAFDSLAAIAAVSFFNAGPLRGELSAQHTRYYNQNQDLTTLFLKLDFAR